MIQAHGLRASLPVLVLLAACAACEKKPVDVAAPSPALAAEKMTNLAPQIARFVSEHGDVCRGQRRASSETLARADRLAQQIRVQMPQLQQRDDTANLARRMLNLLQACTRIAQAHSREQAPPPSALLQWRGVQGMSSDAELQSWTLQEIARRRSAWLAAGGSANLRAASHSPGKRTQPIIDNNRAKLLHMSETSAASLAALRSSCVVDGLRLFSESTPFADASATLTHRRRLAQDLEAAALAAADVQLNALAHSETRAKEILRGHSQLDDAAIDRAIARLQKNPFAAVAALRCQAEFLRFNRRWQEPGLSPPQRRHLFESALARQVLDEQSLAEALAAIDRERRRRTRSKP